jgi:hypothetical protein
MPLGQGSKLHSYKPIPDDRITPAPDHNLCGSGQPHLLSARYRLRDWHSIDKRHLILYSGEQLPIVFARKKWVIVSGSTV